MYVKPPFANIYWFPLAALYSAIMLPWSVGGQFGWFSVPVGLQQPWGHAHEMIFGFALAVIAGYIAGPQPKPQVLSMIALWFIARLSFWFAPTSILTATLNIAFAATLVWKLAPTFLRTAKKWRNKAVGFVLVGLAITVMGFYGGFHSQNTSALRLTFLLEAVLLLSVLMFYMGGRMLAPSLAGHFKRHNKFLKDRVQPRFEGSILLLFFLILIINLLPFTWVPNVMAVLLFLCALLCSIRMLRWRPWWCYNRADLLSLLLGYSWIIAGWVYIGISLITSNISITQALHTITVGALGTLTLTVMARGRMHRVLRDPNAIPFIYILPLFISAAAVLRLSAVQLGYIQSLMLAATCWSIAFLGLFVWLLWLAKIEAQKNVLSDG